MSGRNSPESGQSMLCAIGATDLRASGREVKPGFYVVGRQAFEGFHRFGIVFQIEMDETENRGEPVRYIRTLTDQSFDRRQRLCGFPDALPVGIVALNLYVGGIERDGPIEVRPGALVVSAPEKNHRLRPLARGVIDVEFEGAVRGAIRFGHAAWVDTRRCWRASVRSTARHGQARIAESIDTALTKNGTASGSRWRLHNSRPCRK